MTWRPVLRPGSMAVAVVMVLIVAGSVYLDMQHRSPGPIADVHGQLPAMADRDGCEMCHGQDSTGMTDACLHCHETINDQLNGQTGFHGQLAADLAPACERCHSDHHGREFQITNFRSFQLAGIEDVQQYRHTGLDFRLVGKHGELTCDACHKLAWTQTLSSGEKRFQGLDQQCTACHEDTHQGRFGTDCESCHGQKQPFARAPGFEHTHAFALEGAHARVECQRCHPSDSDHSVEQLLTARGAAPDTLATRTCQQCHSSPHRERFLAFAASQHQMHPSATCQVCHPSSHASFSGPDATLTPAQHEWTGFSLSLPHERVTCQQCHPGYAQGPKDLAAYGACYPGRSADDCRSCHGDPHHGQFASGPFAKLDCLGCHVATQFWPSTFTVVQHDQARFPLRGAHRSVACTECHQLPPAKLAGSLGPDASADVGTGTQASTSAASASAGATTNAVTKTNRNTSRQTLSDGAVGRAAPRLKLASGTVRDPKSAVARIFHGTPRRCDQCHEDVHHGEFDKGPWAAADCDACHSEQSFRPALFGIEQHGLTAFPLTGAHQAVACFSCHRSLDAQRSPDPDPTTAGRLSSPDDGDKRHSSRRHSSRRRSTGPGRWARTIFGTLPQGAAAVRSTASVPPFSAAPTACASCHDDVHQGRFQAAGLPQVVDGRTGCARCHSAEQFDHVRAQEFDHGLWTGYVLVGAHRRAQCVTCHAGRPDQPDRRLGPSPGTRCQDCHADPHVGQFGSPTEVDCHRCHRAEATFQDLLFDHQRDSTFALDADHIGLKCSACHRRQRLRSGGSAVRYKPLGKACGDCHIAAGPRRATSGRSR